MFTVGAFLQTKQLLTIKKSQEGRIFSRKINFFCPGIHRESIMATKGEKWERVNCSLSRTAEVKNCLSVSTERSGTFLFLGRNNMAAIKELQNTATNSENERELSYSYNSYEERNRLLPGPVDHGPHSPEAVRPCYYILQILGVWKPHDGKFEFIWRVYHRIVYVLWLECLVAIMCLDFVHYGFQKDKIHVREIMNSACTCLVFLCPYVFTVYYFNQGQFVQLVFSVQCISDDWHRKLSRISRWYTLMSVCLWVTCAAFFMVHWFPFFSKSWHYAVYIPVILYIAGWWGTWLSIYGFVCHVHSLHIDTVVDEMKSRECRSTYIVQKHSQLLTSLERTQKDFSLIISLALAYHALDLIIFSFAYFNSDFGSDYPIWQYIGTVIYDLISIIVKLYPPAIVAAASHRIVVQAAKRCHMTTTSTHLPLEDMQLYQCIAWSEKDMGLKILGIRITVELAMKIFMTIITAAVSFVAFVIPRLK